ncbi:molybdenum cofactor biosynthesis protein MoaE [Desulfohalovibrio reitneri]|uniref:molybdenum cofactor biosynthesis protein MoaE n=1 Tax=Desulfohalovibrio reitneri TaxID=1307759 RepID=UPI0004A6E02D|nr:molybdenum cofactor biosynthesis protein MoaE [Desulfohalovibrio reitneri]
MDIATRLTELKKDPSFRRDVGMVLIHNGVVRGTSRDGTPVESVDIRVDRDKVDQLVRECNAREGIHTVLAEAYDGNRVPGDDVLYLVVAGDIRENVKAALSDLLDQIKTQAVSKKEHPAAAG